MNIHAWFVYIRPTTYCGERTAKLTRIKRIDRQTAAVILDRMGGGVGSVEARMSTDAPPSSTDRLETQASCLPGC
jgi:hypothetical protein